MRKLLILDLDETLIHGDMDSSSWEFLASGIPVFSRPGAREFLERMELTFDLAVWTSASADYASEIVNHLFPHPPAFLWCRERCVSRLNHETLQTDYIKDLKKVHRRGWDLGDVLVVDDSPEKLRRQYGNLVRVPPFLGQPDDVLEKLGIYLLTLADAPNVREIEKRGWLEQMTMRL
jgi:RNA polymerase II subunit A small phosphatase-like protein